MAQSFSFELLQPKFIIYMLLGLLMLAPNAVITITILVQRALRRRKEYLFIGGLAFADSLQGSALFSAGLHRSYLILKGLDNQPATMRDCIAVYNNFVWIMIEPAAAWMMAALSFDRLFAVSKPIKYRRRRTSYGLTVVAAVYMGSIILGSVGITLTYLSPEHKNFTALCLCQWSVPIEYYRIYRSIVTSGAISSDVY